MNDLNNRPTLTITRGISSSGKTTHAIAWVAENPKKRCHYNRDSIRNELFAGKIDHSPEQEIEVTRIQKQLVQLEFADNRDVMIDDMNLHPLSVIDWREFAEANNVNFDIIVFTVSLETAKANNRKRVAEGGLYVPDSELERMYGKTIDGVPRDNLY